MLHEQLICTMETVTSFLRILLKTGCIGRIIQGGAPHVQGAHHVVARLPHAAVAPPRRHVPNRSLRSSVAHLLIVPRTQTNIGKRAFSVTAPSTWNALPNYVRQSDSLAIFKSRLKTALFTKAFDS